MIMNYLNSLKRLIRKKIESRYFKKRIKNLQLAAEKRKIELEKLRIEVQAFVDKTLNQRKMNDAAMRQLITNKYKEQMATLPAQLFYQGGKISVR